MNELKKVTYLVKLILEEDERARNSDNYLYSRVIEIVAERKAVDVSKVSVTDFLLKQEFADFPCFETVRRARQKIQQDIPELAGSHRVRMARKENEEVYREYAKGDLI